MKRKPRKKQRGMGGEGIDKSSYSQDPVLQNGKTQSSFWSPKSTSLFHHSEPNITYSLKLRNDFQNYTCLLKYKERYGELSNSTWHLSQSSTHCIDNGYASGYLIG